MFVHSHAVKKGTIETTTLHVSLIIFPPNDDFLSLDQWSLSSSRFLLPPEAPEAREERRFLSLGLPLLQVSLHFNLGKERNEGIEKN